MKGCSETTISYLLLCHDSPERIVRLVNKLLYEDETGHIVIHFDKKSSRKKFIEINESLGDNPRCVILEERVKCGWGGWGIVDASIKMLKHAFENFNDDYFYLLSEYCYPVKNIACLKEYLYLNQGVSFIECKDSEWIKAGIREDRYLYRHFLNKKEFPRLHRLCYKAQKKIGIKRHCFTDINVKFGSQWWCLDRLAVYSLIGTEASLTKKFKYTWIPDECYFQTLMYYYKHPFKDSLTYYKFTSSGTPEFFDYKNVNKDIPDNYFFIRKCW